MPVSPDRGLMSEVYAVPSVICGRPQMYGSGLYLLPISWDIRGLTESTVGEQMGSTRGAGCTHCIPLIVDVL